MRLNRKWMLVIALVLSLTMVTTGTLAYLTDRDTAENTFTMGNVDIKLEEDFPEGGAPIKPGQTVNKDAWIENDGSKDAWVWMTVSVPEEIKDYVTLVWANGYAPTANSPKVIDGQEVWTVLVKDALKAKEKTGVILDAVTLSGLVDYQDGKYVVVDKGVSTELKGLDAQNQLIVTVNAYAVQTDGLDSVEAAYRAYNRQWGGVVSDPSVEYNGVDYQDIYTAVEQANANGGGKITLRGSAALDKPVEITSSITIDGYGNTYTRAAAFDGNMFVVKAGSTLTLEDIVLDGEGKKVASNMIVTESNSHIVLNKGAVLKNNNGAVAVNLGTRIGSTLTLNGAEIINNTSDAGAIWGGGNITVNEGSKINNNSSTGVAGAIRMVSNCNLTMNGGEICNNTAATSGGAIWGYGASTYNFNGGKMSGNKAAAGGAIWTGDSSKINISGDFEMCNNVADDAGAIRFTNYTTLNMTGGKISGNVSKNSQAWNGFYGYNVAPSITGGELADDVTIQCGYIPTVGGSGITGVVHFALATNHNTVNLAKDFGQIKFTVAAGSNFANFHFQPAADYTYTEGDEAKLVCLNEGYVTYWDETAKQFKLKAN